MSCLNCKNCSDKVAKNSLLSRLNKRVTIISPDGPPDEYGEPTEGPVTVATVWAAIEPLRGREFFAAQAVNAEVTTRIRIRYRKGIDRTMVVKHQEHEFEIMYIIDPEFAHQELQLMCRERQ